MKSCPACCRSFPENAGFCPADGAALKPFAEVTPVDRSDRRLGQRLGERYELRRVVADGAMGRVYEGVDHVHDIRVAVKVLHPEVATDEVALERFRREYAISRELDHKHVVRVFDFLEQQGTWFLVMEFLDGEELRVVLDRGERMPSARILHMVCQIALALEAAHGRRYVHRDLKPDNLFLSESHHGQECKILDFGSVKDRNEGSKKLTVMGTTLGSPHYMSPEQAQGLETLDGRADIFSLAAIVYECITGQVPFDGRNAPQILLAILGNEPMPLRAHVAPESLPSTLDRVVIEQGMAKHPDRRPQSAGAFADALLAAYGLELGYQRVADMQVEDVDALLKKAVWPGDRLAPTARMPSRALEAVRDPFARDSVPSPRPSAAPSHAPAPVPSQPVGSESPELDVLAAGLVTPRPVGLWVGAGLLLVTAALLVWLLR